MRLVFLGPPGSGKGTQARMVGERLGIPQVSTGDILREAVMLGTDIGRKAKPYMEGGKLVPDEIMLSLVKGRIEEPDCSGGFVLDGFPRTLAQALGLEEILQSAAQSIDAVILIDTSDEVVLKRLSRRRVCPQCKALYNLEADPPEADQMCDRCGVQLILRTDDSERTVATRLNVYRKDTLPVVEYYESKGVLRKVDGSREIEQVLSSIMEEISEVRKS